MKCLYWYGHVADRPHEVQDLSIMILEFRIVGRLARPASEDCLPNNSLAYRTGPRAPAWRQTSPSVWKFCPSQVSLWEEMYGAVVLSGVRRCHRSFQSDKDCGVYVRQDVSPLFSDRHGMRRSHPQKCVRRYCTAKRREHVPRGLCVHDEGTYSVGSKI